MFLARAVSREGDRPSWNCNVTFLPGTDWLGFALLFAQAAPDPKQGDADWQQQLLSMLPLFLVMGLMFYFVVLRPAQKEEKSRLEALRNLKKNDRVVTKGGIVGYITSIKFDEARMNRSEVTIRTHEDTKLTVLLGMIERLPDLDVKPD